MGEGGYCGIFGGEVGEVRKNISEKKPKKKSRYRNTLPFLCQFGSGFF